ncbi:MAG TPA: hypothetical protein VEK32_18475, partial [Thermodesulfobacteriota bacterium]|nr:hypothetical protein [Thermodesulfobacteriota bacterium]
RGLERVSVASSRLAPRQEDPKVEQICHFAVPSAPTKVKPALVNPQDLKVVKEEKPDRHFASSIF